MRVYDVWRNAATERSDCRPFLEIRASSNRDAEHLDSSGLQNRTETRGISPWGFHGDHAYGMTGARLTDRQRQDNALESTGTVWR
jgi:hypothetical protein